MKQVRMIVPAEHEIMAEEWLWGMDAFAVASPAPHDRERSLTAQFTSFDAAAFDAAFKQFCAVWELNENDIVLSFEDVDAENWQERWRESFQPLQAGSFRILPEWQAGAKCDARTLLVYPGQAFGTGQHETTRLIIEALEALDLNGKHVLDAGCGTGILAIAAEKLGAAACFGFDIDPDCHENMERHLAMNQTQHVTLKIGVLEDFDIQDLDVVLANITLNVLREFWPAVKRRMKPGAAIISSGILLEQQQEALVLLQAHGYQVDRVTQQGEWCAIVAKLP